MWQCRVMALSLFLLFTFCSSVLSIRCMHGVENWNSYFLFTGDCGSGASCLAHKYASGFKQFTCYYYSCNSEDQGRWISGSLSNEQLDNNRHYIQERYGWKRELVTRELQIFCCHDKDFCSRDEEPTRSIKCDYEIVYGHRNASTPVKTKYSCITITFETGLVIRTRQDRFGGRAFCQGCFNQEVSKKSLDWLENMIYIFWRFSLINKLRKHAKVCCCNTDRCNRDTSIMETTPKVVTPKIETALPEPVPPKPSQPEPQPPKPVQPEPKPPKPSTLAVKVERTPKVTPKKDEGPKKDKSHDHRPPDIEINNEFNFIEQEANGNSGCIVVMNVYLMLLSACGFVWMKGYLF